MMRPILVSLLAIAMASAASAADKPSIGPAPAWVKPVPFPAADAKDDGAAVRMLVQDQQTSFERGRRKSYAASILKIETPQGLGGANVNFAWNPETDTPIVHKLLIHRGDKVIDVLASQTFTVVRRESNLENAMLDGVLTATLQPEGLQVGDVVEFAMSVETSDPVLAGHVEQIAGGWNGLPITHAALSAQWPASLPIRLRQTEGLPPVRHVNVPGGRAIELDVDNLQPFSPPNGAPLRFQLGRLVEMTDFKSWADVGALLGPLFQKAAVIPATGSLQDELGRIRAASADPKKRAEAALALVQDRVRYVFLGMNSGSLVPADAATTWSRRFGDCKAKTVLLMALLHALDIPADAVAVNAIAGDGLDQRLPMIGMFNHVLVRATVKGRVYWLDGTRTGDSDIDAILTPNFGWGLPLLEKGAALVRIVPPPLDKPIIATTITIDASAGIALPAPTWVETKMHGDAALGLKLNLANMAPDMRDKALRDYWRGQYDFIDIDKVDAVYDPANRDERLTMQGSAHLEWKDGWYQTNGTGLGWEADFHRDPGPNKDAPFAVAYPIFFTNKEVIKLPPSFGIGRTSFKPDVALTVAGVELHRHQSVSGDTLTIESSTRAISTEFPAADAPAAQAALRKLARDNIYLQRPESYRLSDEELAAQMKTTPSTADEYVARGNSLLDHHRFKEGIADLDKAITLDPKSANAFADRGMANAYLDNIPAAEKDYDTALGIDPRNAVVFRGRGILAGNAGQPAAAVAAYSKSLEIEPNNTFALRWRANAYHLLGDEDRALDDAAAALRIDPTGIDLYLLRSAILKSRGDEKAATAELAALIASQPDNPYAHVAAGQAWFRMGHQEQAMAELNRAIAIKPESSIYIARSEIRPKTDLASKRADLDLAQHLAPKDPTPLIYRSKLEQEVGDNAAALKLANAALALQPSDPDMKIMRGIVESRAGQAILANKDFIAARKGLTSAAEFNNSCWSKATAGVALASALADCDTALEKAPGEAAFLDSRGLVLLRMGRIDEAIGAYDAALKKSATQASSLYGRGVAYARKGDKVRSTADIQAATRISPMVGESYAAIGVKP